MIKLHPIGGAITTVKNELSKKFPDMKFIVNHKWKQHECLDIIIVFPKEFSKKQDAELRTFLHKTFLINCVTFHEDHIILSLY